jgi:hypothetical protein
MPASGPAQSTSTPPISFSISRRDLEKEARIAMLVAECILNTPSAQGAPAARNAGEEATQPRTLLGGIRLTQANGNGSYIIDITEGDNAKD